MQCEINKLNTRITCTNDAVVDITVNDVRLLVCEVHLYAIVKRAGSVSESEEARQQRESWEAGQ